MRNLKKGSSLIRNIKNKLLGFQFLDYRYQHHFLSWTASRFAIEMKHLHQTTAHYQNCYDLLVHCPMAGALQINYDTKEKNHGRYGYKCTTYDTYLSDHAMLAVAESLIVALLHIRNRSSRGC